MFSHLRLLTDLSERAHAALPIARALALACDADLCLTYASRSPEDRAEAARLLVQRTMEAAMATVVPGVPIVAEAHVARSWADK